jgi:hypothetical protein
MTRISCDCGSLARMIIFDPSHPASHSSSSLSTFVTFRAIRSKSLPRTHTIAGIRLSSKIWKSDSNCDNFHARHRLKTRRKSSTLTASSDLRLFSAIRSTKPSRSVQTTAYHSRDRPSRTVDCACFRQVEKPRDSQPPASNNISWLSHNLPVSLGHKTYALARC